MPEQVSERPIEMSVKQQHAGAERVTITVKVNGKTHTEELETRTLLVDFIRETLGLTGTHVGCDTSYCGACTVLLDGVTVKSCTMFAAQAHDGEILIVEGLSK